jgi:thiosulfate reductase / polysulfide reductase chain A
LKDGRGKVQVYFSYCVATPQTWPEGRSLTTEVLKDEKLIPFHVCSDVMYSEQAHYADLILPDASYTERWGFDTRNNMELRDYVTLRQPMVPPPGECVSFVDSMIEIAKRIGPDTAKYFRFKDHEDWLRQRCGAFTKRVGSDGFDYMREHGVWQDMSKTKYCQLYNWELTPEQLKDTRVDEAGQVRRKAANGAETIVGLMVGGKARRGFATPSRKFSVYHADIEQAAKDRGFTEDGGKGMPTYFPVPTHQKMTPQMLHLVSFKWNVHTQARTQSQKYLSEIVHHNPMWVHTSVAKSLGVSSGDEVEITTYRPYGHQMHNSGEVIGRARITVHVTEGIHPRTVAVSNTLGNVFHGRAATAQGTRRRASAGWDSRIETEDQDLVDDVWWDARNGGTGAGYNINAILPIQSAPLVGMQGWYDTVCTLRRV